MTRSTLVDAALAVVTFAISFAFSYGPDALRMSVPGATAISVAAAVIVGLSGRRPALALIAAAVLTVALPTIGSTFAVMDIVVVLVTWRAVVGTALPIWLVAAVGLTALTINDAWLRVAFDESFAQPSVLYPALLTALAVGLGVTTRRVWQQHEELVALREADRQRAVVDERRRIARDLHDVAAHHLSALIVRNKLATRLGTPTALAAAAEFSARTAADTLDGLRGVVQVLTLEDRGPRTPSPTLADLDDMVARAEAAGLRVERGPAHQALRSGDLPSDVEVAVVRIAQEALTNVLRHRGPGRAWLQVRRLGPDVAVSVEDDGPAPPPPEAGSASAHVAGRHGLVGMRERAGACGGRLEIGASRHGGWRVVAVLPR